MNPKFLVITCVLCCALGAGAQKSAPKKKSAAAQSTITGASLTVGSITNASSISVPAGQVISQDPAAGASALAGPFARTGIGGVVHGMISHFGRRLYI